MVLLDGGFVVVFGLVFFIGLFGFIAMAIMAVMRFLGFMFRGLLGLPPAMPHNVEAMTSSPRKCFGVNCGHVNPPHAHFCARCGRRLDLPPRDRDVDRYG